MDSDILDMFFAFTGNTHLDGFKPARLLYLVIDDRLVLVDALVPSAREDHILETEREDRTKCDIILLSFTKRAFKGLLMAASLLLHPV